MTQRRHTDIKLEELTIKKAQIDAQIQALSAQRRLHNKKDEDRIKWLLGTLVFDRLSDEPALQSPELLELVRRELPERMTKRDQDRGLWQILFDDTQDNHS